MILLTTYFIVAFTMWDLSWIIDIPNWAEGFRFWFAIGFIIGLASDMFWTSLLIDNYKVCKRNKKVVKQYLKGEK